MDTIKKPCPDRSRNYLTSLQTTYREDDIPAQKLPAATRLTVLPANPYRVMVCMSVIATAKVDVYMINAAGDYLLYASFTTPTGIVVSQQLQFILPTMSWAIQAVNNDLLTGLTITKI